jgi:hypothetical protein
LETLLMLHTRMKACGGQLTLFNLSARVYEEFTATHLQQILGICREGTTGREPMGSSIFKYETSETEQTGAAD